MRILGLSAAAAAVVLLLAQAGSGASHPVGWYCSPTADTITIFTNFPVDAVATADGATAPTFTTPNSSALCVDSIETSHVNDPAAGTIGLTPSGGSLSGQGGPWTATAANGIWKATPSQGTDTAVIQGTYSCLDSKPATWTYSQADPTKTGFCRVTGRFAQPDNTPPTVSFDSPTAGSLLHGTVRFNVSASDGESGIEHLEVQTSAPNAGSWTKRATGTGVLDWDTTNVADGTYDVRVVAFDIAGNSTPTAAISLTIDNTPPQITLTCNTGGGASPCAAWYTQAVAVSAVASDANLSGPLRYTTDGSNPLLSNTAQTYTGTLQVTQSEVVRFGAADLAGNLTVVQTGVDLSAPPAPDVTQGGLTQFAFLKLTRASFYTVYHRSTVAGQVQLVVPTTDDPESGVQSVSFPTSFALPTWHAAAVQPTSATYSWDVNPGEPSTITIQSTNGAGLTGPGTDIAFAADDSAPTGGTISCVPAACSNATGPVTVTFAGASDAGSGIKEIRYTTDGSDPSATSGTVGTSVTVTAAATVKFWAVDNVGNAAVLATQSVADAHSAAGTFDVNTTADTSDANAGNGVCADTANACSLRAAVEEANALAAGSTIHVPAGNYQLLHGALTITTGMTITGAGARTATVAAPGNDRVVDVAATANPVTITGLTLAGGTATGVPGNGFFGGDVRNQGNLTLVEDTITNGSAFSGGGVGNMGGTLVIRRSTISGNVALNGGGDSGGVQNWGDGATHHGALTIENSTITGNQARLAGGVFDWNDAADTLVIRNSTIAGNQGGDRGIGGIGVGNGSSATLQNTIVAGNTVNGAPNNCGAGLTSAGNNLESGTDCHFTAAGDIQNTDPQLGSLANNGGQTDTMLPSSSSRVIDAGADNPCPSPDQRGTSRPQGAHCDIGAVEVVHTSLVVTNTNDSGAGSLRQAILSANAQSGADVITFAIPGGGVHTITPASPLPAITDAVTIDGYTQPGAQANSAAAGSPTDAVLDIELNGGPLTGGVGGAGLEVTGSGSLIRGLVIDGGFTYGIEIDGAGATNNVVAGNYVGTTPDGGKANGLGIYGVLLSQGASGNRIGGTSHADRNVIGGTTGISDGGGVGVGLALGALRNTVVGNLIGLSADSTTYVPNATGLMILSGAHDNQVGNGDKTVGNVISGNRVGVRLQQSGTTGNVLTGNWIGITFVLDNGQQIDSGNTFDGVDDTESASGNTFSNNVVANNGGAGVSITFGVTGVTLRQNGIRNNGALGIDLGGDGVTPNDAGDGDTGPNNLQNFPVLTDAGSGGSISGTLNSAPSTQYTVEVFGTPTCDASGNGEGQAFAGSTTVTTDANGNATFTVAGSFGPAAAYATATATGPDGTSEFSACFRLSNVGSVLTVNSAADTDDGSCSTANCTLREAINAANAHPGADAIRFAILSGPQVIHVTSPLPALTGTTTLDGTSQPGWVAAPIVTVDGSGVAADGIVARGASSVVRGLVVDGFGGIGIHVFGDGSTVAGNYAGITATGTGVLGNGGDGIRVEGATGVTVGGSAPADRNVVGGNRGHGIFLFAAHTGTVRGNYAGTDAAGAATAGNGLDGIAVDGGGSNTITGNVASGNHGQGISLFTVNALTGQTSGNVVRGNVVGSNSGDGIRMDSASNSTIGGTLDGQGNTVQGNGVAGIAVQNETSAANRISGNSIDTLNGTGPAIDLRDGSNGGQPAPAVTVTDAAHVGGTLAGSAPNTAYTIEVFQSPAPLEGSCTSEAVTFLGSATATTNANGSALWSVPVSVDPGSVATATATSASGNTSELSACVQTTASTTLDVAFTVDQSSTTAGAQSFALDSLPPQLFTQLATGDPASAPIPSAPIPSAAVGAAPIPSAPIPSAPIPSAPIPSAPIPSAPIPSAPIPSAPIPSAGLGGLPIPSADVTNPLDAILLSSLPNLDVTAMFAGTSIAGKLPQQYTLGDVYRTPSALAYLTAHYTAGDLNLGGTFLRGVRTLSYLLGGKTLNQINIGQDWCTALANAGGSCAGVDVTKTTVIGLDIMGQLGSLDLGHLKVSDLTNGLNGTLVGNARLARIAFQQTTMAQIPVSSVPGITTCTTCATLGDAAAANAIVDVPTTLQDLGSLLNNVTLSELVVAMVPRSALPWEQESFVGWQGFGGQAQKLQYHLDFDATCPISAGLSVRVRLPFGFVYVPGSTSLQVGAAAATPVTDPALDPKSGATWSGLPVVGCTTGQREHLRLNFQGEPGYKLGVSLSTATITANGDTSAITDAPVFVNRNWTAALDRSTEPAIAKDTIVLSHIDSAGGTNYFKFPEQGRGKLVTIYMKPPAGADFDLYVVRPAPQSLLASPIPSAPIPSAPIPSAPIPSAPIPSADTSVNTTTDNPPPELLDDGPLPGGEVSVDSITRSAGGVEAVTFRQAGSTGFDEIAVAGYNGAYSDQPFELRVQVQDPPQLPANCPVRAITPINPGTLPVGVDPSTQNLALVNVGRMNAMYGTSRTKAMLDDLQIVLASAHGAVIPIDGNADVAGAAQAWDLAPCSIDAANNYVHAINALVATYRATLNNLRSITLVGDDEQIPSARVADFVPTSSEFDNTNALAFLTQGGTVDDAAYAAAALGYVLTDDAYGAFHTRQLFGHEFFLPEVAVGRLVETPEEIDGQLQQYIHASGVLSPTTGFVTGYDFMSDGAKAVDDGLSGRIGATPSATNTLLQDTWGKAALQPFLNGTTPAAKIDSWNAHYDFHRLMPAVYTGPSDLLTTDLVPAAVSQRFKGDIFFTMGCHAGQSLADTLFANAAQTHDWAQAYSAGGAAVFIGNTGFGYGDTASVALSERLMSIFAGHLAFNGSVGEKLLQTKNDYFSSMGVYGPYDEKSLEEATFYGLPFWQVNSPGESAPTPPGPLSAADANGIKTAPLTITPHLTKVTDPRGSFWKAGDGTVFVQGRTIQPLVTTDVTQPASGYVAHGFLPSALVTDDSNKDVNLYYAKPMIDLASHEPEPGVTNDVFPASPVKVAQADYLGARHSTLDVIAGQSRPGSNPTLQNERLITSLGGVVTYAPASATDYTAPIFGQTGSFVSGGTATIFATVTDNAAAGVIKVRAFFTTGGPWQFVDLTPLAGSPNVWQATGVAVSTDKIEVGFVAEDASGNTGWMTGKGILVESYTPSAPPAAPGITIKQPLDGGSYNAGQSVPASYSCTSVVVIKSCVGTVANGAPIDTSTVGPKQFTVTATPLVGDGQQKTVHYDVVYFFGGFQPPISSTGLNSVKAGNSVPVKFSLHGNYGLNIFLPGYPQSGPIPCTGIVDSGVTTETSGNSTLSYDATSDTYTYSWKTDKSWKGCRQLLVVLNDGVVHRANFQFK